MFQGHEIVFTIAPLSSMDALQIDPDTTPVCPRSHFCQAKSKASNTSPGENKEIVDSKTRNLKFSFRIRNSPLGHFFHSFKNAVAAFFLNEKLGPARSQPLEGRTVLLNDMHKPYRCIKREINDIISIFDDSETETYPLGSSRVRTLLQSMPTDDSHLEPNANVPGSLCVPDSQHVINYIQKKLDYNSGSSSRFDRGIETAITLIRVLCWLSLRTGTFPEGFVIKGDLKTPGPEDYGSGGLHDIFRSEYKEKLVALKHPRAFGMVRPSDRRKLEDDFRRCSLVAFNMRHENVLQVWGIADNPRFNGFSLVCPWMKMGDLRSYLDQQTINGQLSGSKLVQTVNRWLLEIAKGLEYLHEHSVIHGDIRGVNILLDGNMVAHLTPFGSSVILSANEFSNPGLQSPIPWIAPELFDPKKFGLSCAMPSLAADVYAFGCTCVELYTSQSPYPRLRDSEILSKVIKGSRPQRPTKQGEAMPDSLWNFVRRCWDQRIARRPSISEAVLVLTDLADQRCKTDPL